MPHLSILGATLVATAVAAQPDFKIEAPEDPPNVALVRYYAEAQGVGMDAPNSRSRFVTSIERLDAMLKMYASISPLLHEGDESAEERKSRMRDFELGSFLSAKEAPEIHAAYERLIDQLIADRRLPDRFLADEIWGTTLIPPVQEPGGYLDHGTHASATRTAATLHLGAMRIARERGDDRLYVQSATAIRGAAYGISREPGIIHPLVAISIDAALQRQLVDDLMQGALEPAVLDQIAELLERDAVLDARHSLIGEYIGNFDMFGVTLGFIKDPGFREMVDRWFEISIRCCSDDPHEARAALAELQRVKQELEDTPAFKLWVGAPASDEFAWAIRGYQTMLRGVVTLVAIERYRLENGEPPASLATLVPEYLGSLPVDPFSGEPFGYQLLSDDERGRPYLLYSVGGDGEDNGGLECPDGNFNPRGSSRAGDRYDYIVNYPES